MFPKTNVVNVATYLFKDVLLGILRGIKDSLYGIYCMHVYYKRPKSENRQYTSPDYEVTKHHTSRKSRSRDSSVKKDTTFLFRGNLAQEIVSIGCLISDTLLHFLISLLIILLKKCNLELDIKTEIYKCCAYNGVIYGVSVFLFYYGILSLLKFVLDLTLTKSSSQEVWNIAKPALTLLFDVFWTVPLFIIFKIINVFWFQDIANGAYRQRYGRPQAFSISGIGSQISDSVFSVVIEALFLIQASLMQFVPYPSLATILSVVHFSLLNSLYSFEYLWCNKGWTFHKRISYIELNWPYFVGFGMPLSCVTFFSPSMIPSAYMEISPYFWSGFLYSVCFPLFIISATEALSVSHESTGPPLKLFAGVIWFSSVVTKRTFAKEKWSR